MNIRLDDLIEGRIPETDDYLNVWVPGEKIVAHVVSRPAVPRSQWQKTIPWQLAVDLPQHQDNYVFSILESYADNKIVVLVAELSSIEEWNLLASRNSKHIRSFIPDYFALPLNDGIPSFYQDANRVIVRTALEHGFCISREWFDVLLTYKHPELVGAGQLKLVEPDWNHAKPKGVPNPDYQQSNAGNKSWRGLSSITLIAVILLISSLSVETRYYSESSDQIQAYTEALLTLNSPESTRDRSELVEQLRQALKTCSECAVSSLEFRKDAVLASVYDAEGKTKEWLFSIEFENSHD